MKVVVLVGGVGGARFLVGLRALLGGVDDEITALVNVGDDIWLHGLRVCPDLDTCMYTLGGGIDPGRGWGRADESWTIKEELAAYGVQPDWFGLGDRDVATHLVRSRMLRAGYPLSAVTEALCARWKPGVRLVPASDDRVETHVIVDDPAGDQPGGQRAIHFQEWWVRHQGKLPARRFASLGADRATPAPGVLSAIAGADVVILAPSNPVVSIGAILAVPGISDALRAGPAPVVGLSPIVGGRPLRGMADACLDAIGVQTSAEAVGRHYGARGTGSSGTGTGSGSGTGGGLLDGWLVHDTDTAEIDGVRVRSVPLLMTDVEATAKMAAQALEIAGV